MNTPDSAKMTIEPFDLTRRMRVYDGMPEDWNAPIKVSYGLLSWCFTLAEIDQQDISQLKTILGMDHFRTIIETQGYTHTNNEFATYQGTDGLPLRYFIRAHQSANIHKLVLVGFGEFQPSRWIAHIEGIWRITGMNS